jgi:hypothetical protein
MTELYTIKITGILASNAGNPAHTWMADSLPDIVRAVFDINFTAEIFATHEDGRIEFIGNAGSGMWANERIYQSAHPIDDPDKLIGDALDDANGFYEMFDGWEGVEERVERLHQAMNVMDKNEAKKYAPPEISPAAQEELDKAFAKVRPDLYPAGPEGILTCPECGEKVERTHALQKYCSATCRKRRNYRVAKETEREVNS